MGESQNLANLLNSISSILKKYDNHAIDKGYYFNIFKVLKMETKEVKTHSAFLAELLNPKGSHGQKDVFLKLFIEEITEDTALATHIPNNNAVKFEILNYSTTTATANVEKYIGEKTEDSGGRIDIIIESPKNPPIIIENKIDAIDQPQQMIRYWNYGKDKNALLFYLSKWDNSIPHEISTVIKEGEIVKYNLIKGEDFKCISYQKEITNWLIKCIGKVQNDNLLKTIITQYLNLVKYLTNQTLNKEMETEIAKSIIEKGGDAIEAVFAIHDKKTLKKALLKKFGNDILKEIESIEFEFEFVDSKNDVIQFCFNIKNWGKGKLYIGFLGKEEYSANAFIGIWPETDKDFDTLKITIESKVKDLGIGQKLEWEGYLMIYKFPLVDFRNNGKIWRNIKESEQGKQVIDKIREIIEALKTVENQLVKI